MARKKQKTLVYEVTFDFDGNQEMLTLTHDEYNELSAVLELPERYYFGQTDSDGREKIMNLRRVNFIYIDKFEE